MADVIPFKPRDGADFRPQEVANVFSIKLGTRRQVLKPFVRNCPACCRRMWAAYNNYRTVATLNATLGLKLQVYRCINKECDRFHKPYGPEWEGRIAMPRFQFGLDVIVAVGETATRLAMSPGEKFEAVFHGEKPWNLKKAKDTLHKHTVKMSIRSIWNIRRRYHDLLKTSPTSNPQLLNDIRKTGFTILDIFEVPSPGDWPPLWIVRDWCSGGILAIMSGLAGEQSLFQAVGDIHRQLAVPITGFVSDGHPTISTAISRFLPNQANNSSHHIEISSGTATKRRADFRFFCRANSCRSSFSTRFMVAHTNGYILINP